MARPDHRIERGQKISSALSASGWNRAQDAADIVLGVTTTQVPGANYVFQRSLAVPMQVWGILGPSTDSGMTPNPIPVGTVVFFKGGSLTEVGSTGEISSGTSALYAQGVPIAYRHDASARSGYWNEQLHSGWGVTAQKCEAGGVVDVIVSGYAMTKLLVLEYPYVEPSNGSNVYWDRSLMPRYAVPAMVHFEGQDATSLHGCLELSPSLSTTSATIVHVARVADQNVEGGVLEAKIRWAGIII